MDHEFIAAPLWSPYGLACLALVSGLLTLTVLARRRHPMASFLALAFFLFLAPTSSLIPSADLLFEHRLYLPMLGASGLMAWGAFALGRLLPPLRRPVVVAGSRDELFQVFENLLENACKYGRAGKRVIVSIRPGEDDIEGAVVGFRDFGPGIAAEHIPRITERFYRVDVEASRGQKGTGLGLAIVKHILTRHKARLAIKSVVGEGSEFAVHFPPHTSAP